MDGLRDIHPRFAGEPIVEDMYKDHFTDRSQLLSVERCMSSRKDVDLLWAWKQHLVVRRLRFHAQVHAFVVRLSPASRIVRHESLPFPKDATVPEPPTT